MSATLYLRAVKWMLIGAAGQPYTMFLVKVCVASLFFVAVHGAAFFTNK